MILPQPRQTEPRRGTFRLAATTALRADRASSRAADALRRTVRTSTGFWLAGLPGSRTGTSGKIGSVITLSVDAGRLGPEAYSLTVAPRRIDIVGGDPAGVFYGVQSLLQLLPAEIFSTSQVTRTWEISCVEVQDAPQFGWRGTMLDVARHFMPKAFVLRLIDLLALHKLNVLHLHLTDDQGWRVEVPAYPRLTEVGAWRTETLVGHGSTPEAEQVYDGTPHGGFYTQDDLREIVAYAAERFVTVVPEIDMPGHMLSAIAAYPELGNGIAPASVWTKWGISPQVLNVDDTTLDFCRTVLSTVMELFPSPFVHCGGDECPKEEWRASPAAQRRIRSLGLAGEDALQAWFTAQMADFLGKNGRRFVGWDEVLDGGGQDSLPADSVVMSWRNESGGILAARAGLDVVMAPCEYTYLDYYQGPDPDSEPLAIGGMTPLPKVYAYDPVPALLDSEDATHVLGSQIQLWTEYVPDPERAEYMLFPRLCAFAEAVWRETPDGYRAFLDRLAPHLERLDVLGVHYRPLD